MTDARRPPSMHIGAAPDDFDHLAFAQLVSLVDGSADDADREWMVSHIEGCDICREDLDDLIQVSASLVAQAAVAAPQTAAVAPPAVDVIRKRRRLKQAIGLGAVAAGVALAFWLDGRRPARDVVVPVSQPVTSTTASPAPTALPPASQTTVSTPVPSPALSPVLTEDEQGRVARALASGRMELPANIAVLRGHTGTLLGAGNPAPAFAPTDPVATAVIQARPQFSWTPRAGATRYSITVFDERFREVAKSGPLKTTTWTPKQDLPRDRVLAWQVTAILGSETAISPAPPHPEARFTVLDSTTVAKLAKERARLATEPIALGLVLAKAGLFAEADSVFQTALTDDRYDRSQVRALLARLRAR